MHINRPALILYNVDFWKIFCTTTNKYFLKKIMFWILENGGRGHEAVNFTKKLTNLLIAW